VHAGVGVARKEKLLRGLKEIPPIIRIRVNLCSGEGRKIFLVGFPIEDLLICDLKFILVEQGED